MHRITPGGPCGGRFAGGGLAYGTAVQAPVAGAPTNVLAVAADARSPLYGDLPTFRENGVPLTIGAFHGVYAPKGTPAAIIAKIATSLQAALGSPELNERMNDVGAAVVYLRGAEAKAYLETQDEAYREIIDALGLRVAKTP